MTAALSIERRYFLDTIRTFIIFFVILQHVALIIPQTAHTVSSSLSGLAVSLTDVFMMPIMFFIAGYFAPPSLDKHGVRAFIAGKFKRIWLPWLAGVLLIMPVSLYFMYRVRPLPQDNQFMSYVSYWANFMKGGLSFPTGPVPTSDSFSHRHLWFLSNLFVFFIAYTFISAVLDKFRKDSAAGWSRRSWPVHAVLATGTVLAALGFFTMSMLTTWGYRALLVLGLIHFEPSRTVVYVVYFTMGVYAYRKGWFAEGWRIGRFRQWLSWALLLLALYSYIVVTSPFTMTTGMKLVMSFLRSFVCITMFGALVSGGMKFWNRPGEFAEFLAENSYTVYIIHYPLLAMAAVMIVPLPLPAMVRAGLLYAFTVLSSWWMSDRIVRPHPPVAIILGIAVNVLMMFLF